MPYVEKLGTAKIEEQLWQWEGVMHDPNIDGFNGWGCKEKLYKIKFMLDEIIEKAPKYAGEEDWLSEQKTKRAFKKLGARNE